VINFPILTDDQRACEHFSTSCRKSCCGTSFRLEKQIWLNWQSAVNTPPLVILGRAASVDKHYNWLPCQKDGYSWVDLFCLRMRGRLTVNTGSTEQGATSWYFWGGQNDCNLLFYLTTKNSFLRFQNLLSFGGNCPVAHLRAWALSKRYLCLFSASMKILSSSAILATSERSAFGVRQRWLVNHFVINHSAINHQRGQCRFNVKARFSSFFRKCFKVFNDKVLITSMSS